MNSAIRITLGVIFVLMGIVGLILPFVPGIVLIMLGLYYLATYNEKDKRLNQKEEKDENNTK